jgi:glucose/arabinose dehydrogenase
MHVPVLRSAAVAFSAALMLMAAALTGSAEQGQPAPGQVAQPSRGGPPFPRVPSLPFPTTPQVFDTLDGSIRVVPFVGGLEIPWGFTFLPNGDILVTEKRGQLRIVRAGKLDPTPIAGVPAVWTTGQGGLFEVTLHPKYTENQVLYLTYSKPGERGAATALARARFDGRTLSDLKEIFVADNWGTGRPHFGGKIAFGPDGMLYLSTGERGERDKAQDTTLHHGVILRLREDGTIPPDNPFAGKHGFRPEVYSYGHRNVQGLVFDGSGALWASEHGPQGGDELNRILPGSNYGWPLVTFGREYSGEPIPQRPGSAVIEYPIVHWAPSIGISGLAIYSGDRFPEWKGNMFVGGLSGQHVQRVAFNDRGPVGRETLIGQLRLRVRDVRQGPDGLLYVAAEGRPGGGLLRIEPGPVKSTAERAASRR